LEREVRARVHPARDASMARETAIKVLNIGAIYAGRNICKFFNFTLN
jgi:hypothetical protein